jgi:pimeloyl-ACP methyl ester carboxylesterase
MNPGVAAGPVGAAAGIAADATSPFVIVPGIGMSHRYSDRLQDALAPSATVLSLDLPGFGPRPRPEQRFTVTDYAHAIAQTLDARSVSGATVIGHSMGAQFAVELARLRADLVSALVLAGPVVDRRRCTARQQALDLLRDLMAEPPTVTAIVTTDYLRTGPRWFFTELRSMLEFHTDDALRDIRKPVLVVRGANDPIARREWCEHLAAVAADGRMLEIDGAGHVVQHAAADRLAAEIVEFAAHVSAGTR